MYWAILGRIWFNKRIISFLFFPVQDGLFSAYYIIVNILTFLVWGWDKFRAQSQQWLAPKKSLFFLMIAEGIGSAGRNGIVSLQDA